MNRGEASKELLIYARADAKGPAEKGEASRELCIHLLTRTHAKGPIEERGKHKARKVLGDKGTVKAKREIITRAMKRLGQMCMVQSKGVVSTKTLNRLGQVQKDHSTGGASTEIGKDLDNAWTDAKGPIGGKDLDCACDCACTGCMLVVW